MTRRPRTHLAVLRALLLTLASAPAGTRAETVAIPFAPTSGLMSPQLVPSGGVAWVEGQRDGFRILQSSPDGSRRTVFQSGRDPVFRPIVSLAAGTGFLVFGQSGIDPTSSGQIPNDRDHGTTLIRTDGSIVRFASPCPYDLCSGRQALASERAFAYLVPRDREPGASLYDTVITDLGSGQTRRINGGGDGRARLAGRYFSYVDDRDAIRAIIVYDWRAGQEAYRIPTSSVHGPFELQEDGKSAFGTPTGTLAWASPAAPFAHPLPVAGGYDYAVSIAADKVLFSRPSRAGFGAGELGVAPINGPARVLRRGIFHGRIDFDGSRTLWAERTCTRTQIRVAALSGLIRRPRLRPARCKLQLGRVTVGRGRLVAQIGCGPFGRRSCAVEGATVRAARTYRGPLGRTKRGVLLASRRKSSRPGRVSLRLTRAGRRLFAARGSARVRVTALLSYPQGDSQRRAAATLARR